MSEVLHRPQADSDTPPRYFDFHRMDHAAQDRLREQFLSAAPFPHLVIDNFLTEPHMHVCSAFPGADWPRWHRFEDAYQHQKRSCGDIDAMPRLFRDMIHELSGPPFLQFLQAVTGLKGLLPDPYLNGGGLHSSGPGGVLMPHADYHVQGRLALYRRINVLIYLNPGWTEEDGGSLELFRKGETRATVAIPPVYGRMVMFLTDDQSIHGFTKPVAAGPDRWRNSIALYYYTSEDTRRFAGDNVTYWQSHGRHRGLQAVQLLGYKALLRGAWMLSKLAHGLNPNLKPSDAAVEHEH